MAQAQVAPKPPVQHQEYKQNAVTDPEQGHPTKPDQGYKAGKKIWGIVEAWREFVHRRKIVDLSIGIVVGSAFTRIVKSLVDDILTPVLGLAMGTNLEERFAILSRPPDVPEDRLYSTRKEAHDDGVVTLNWGVFLQSIINFFIIAWFLFIIMNMLRTVLEETLFEQEEQRKCKECKEEVKPGATRCSHCTSFLDEGDMVLVNTGMQCPSVRSIRSVQSIQEPSRQRRSPST